MIDSASQFNTYYIRTLGRNVRNKPVKVVEAVVNKVSPGLNQ